MKFYPPLATECVPNFCFYKKEEEWNNSFDTMLKDYARTEEILEFAKFSRTGMHRRHICGTFCKLLTRDEIYSSR